MNFNLLLILMCIYHIYIMNTSFQIASALVGQKLSLLQLEKQKSMIMKSIIL